MQIAQAHSNAYLLAVRELFLEYARSLPIDLCFQNFDCELAGLPAPYAPPDGTILLAVEDAEPTGCVAVRKLADQICEMKRLYVRPAFRRRGIGRALAGAAIDAARGIGYRDMRLDTLSSMKEAIALYESLGFQRIAPYCDNPSGCAVFMELDLR